jgi:hypothetical protein
MILRFTPLMIACFFVASASSSFGQGTVSPPPSGSSSSPSSSSPSSTSSTPSASAAAASPSSSSTFSSNSTATATASSTPPADSAPPIVSALAADGLSRGLHQKVGEVAMHDSDWQILAVKALESDGALITTTNIFGSKVHFSCGAVATYALCSFEGNLACSGNVF